MRAGAVLCAPVVSLLARETEDMPMMNIHFVGEWFDCCAPEALLMDPEAVRTHCELLVARRHLPIRYGHFTTTAAQGVIGAMTGNGIHLVVCTFAERNAVTADLFVEESEPAEIAAAMQVFHGLRDAFRPLRALLHRVQPDGLALPVRGRTPCKPTEVFATKPIFRTA